MEAQYFHLPYFIGFVALGILVNILGKLTKKEKLTKLRIIEEIAASFWIALVGAGLLDYYTDMSDFAIYGVSSALGYFHSLLIDMVGKGIIEYIVKKIKKIIDSHFDKGSTIDVEKKNEIELERLEEEV